MLLCDFELFDKILHEILIGIAQNPRVIKNEKKNRY